MTTGPWKPIFLHAYETRIFDLDIRSHITEGRVANITLKLSLSSKAPAFASYVLTDFQGRKVISRSGIPIEGGCVYLEHHNCGSLELWYPVRYGKQPIYSVEVQVSDEVNIDFIP
jgi:beta-mannosidase